MKDLFSDQSVLYRQARPSYPDQIIAEILKYVPSQQFAWDCGAGSGQLTQLLSPYFEQVVATDLSAQQLQQAPYFDNVSYQVQSAEKTTFADQSFDLITVAQAIHWFDFDLFYKEVRRTLKKDGILTIVGYGTPTLHHQNFQEQLDHLYKHTLKAYWDKERHYIDEQYQTIPFPFETVIDKQFSMQFHWTKAQILSYLNTWSAIGHYREQNQSHNLPDLLADFMSGAQDNEEVVIEFPLYLKIGKVTKPSQKHKTNKAQIQLQKIFKREILKFC